MTRAIEFDRDQIEKMLRDGMTRPQMESALRCSASALARALVRFELVGTARPVVRKTQFHGLRAHDPFGMAG